MSSRSNEYGYATTIEVEHDIPAGIFNGLDRGGEIYVDTLLSNYQNHEIYHFQNAGHSKYAAKWLRRGGFWSGEDTGLPPGNYPSSGLVLIGTFDSWIDLQSATDAALGYHFTTYAADYFNDDFDKVWIASYQYVNVWIIERNITPKLISATKPCYTDLLQGYYLDLRLPAKLSKLKPKKTELLTVGYYRENPSEGANRHGSISNRWFSYRIKVKKDTPIYLPIPGFSFGTLWASDPEIEVQIRATPFYAGSVRIVPTQNQLLEVGYYRENLSKPANTNGSLSSRWFSYRIEVNKDTPIYLPIPGFAFGTLWASDPEIEVQIRATPFNAGSVRIVPTQNELLEVGYYRDNSTKSIRGLRSIDWFSYTIEVKKDKPIYLPIKGCVLGTLWISDPAIESQLRAMQNDSTEYAVSDYFPSAVPALFSYWMGLYSIEDAKILPVGTGSLISESETRQVSSSLKILGANNDVWKNANIVDDVGFDIGHPLFEIDQERTFNYHFKPQTDGSFGDLVMDSPRIIELWNHFCSETPYENDIDKDKPRLDTHGKRLKRTSEILGYRLNANGEIDKKIEEEYTRHIVPPKSKVDKRKYGGNSFGSYGMHVRRLPNHFDRNQIKDGGVVAIHDIGQLLLEILDQLNLAIGIQEAGAIELKHEGKIHKYPNLLALTTDIAIHQFNQTSYAKSTHISSLVTQEQTKEIIGGLGLPTVSKSIRREVNGKVAGIPYWGIAPQASLARKIDTCTYNVGIVLGQVL
jgi:hypothetical protein